MNVLFPSSISALEVYAISDNTYSNHTCVIYLRRETGINRIHRVGMWCIGSEVIFPLIGNLGNANIHTLKERRKKNVRFNAIRSARGNVMRVFSCESQAFPVSRQKNYSAHFVLRRTSTGRGARIHHSAVQGRRALRARACVRVRHFSFFTFTLHPKKTNS